MKKELSRSEMKAAIENAIKICKKSIKTARKKIRLTIILIQDDDF